MAVTIFRSVFCKQMNTIRLGLFGLSRIQALHTEDKTTADSSKTFENVNSEAEEEHHHSEQEDDEDVETRILRASLPFVHQHGWTSTTISAGAETLGLSSMVKEMFPRGGGDLALFFIEDCNVELADYLVENTRKELEDKDGPRRRPSMIIRDAVEVRLRMIIPYMDTWPQVMRLMALPQNAPDALKAVSYMVDDIWYHAGDTSTDINWYTKRGVLAALYGATELYMVKDRSEDFIDTWAFLDKRIEDIKQFAKMKENFEKTGADTAQLLFAALSTIRNMTGFNKRPR